MYIHTVSWSTYLVQMHVFFFWDFIYFCVCSCNWFTLPGEDGFTMSNSWICLVIESQSHMLKLRACQSVCLLMETCCDKRLVLRSRGPEPFKQPPKKAWFDLLMCNDIKHDVMIGHQEVWDTHVWIYMYMYTIYQHVTCKYIHCLEAHN